MKKVDEDKGLLKNSVKVVIFDFDDTLYYGVDWSFWYQRVKDFFDVHFSHLSPEEKTKLLAEFHVEYECMTDFDVCQILIAKEGNAAAWLSYRESFPLSEEEKNATVVPQETIEKFRCDGKVSLYIVSNSRLKEIYNFADEMGMDLSIFKHIYVNEFNENDLSKRKYYQQIMEAEGVQPKEVLVIGDSYQSDILPAKKLHMQYYLCENGFTYEEIME